MSIRRTLKQKQKAFVQRTSAPESQYALDSSLLAEKNPPSPSSSTTKLKTNNTQLFGYDISLIYKDLFKTVIVAVTIVAILGVIVVLT